MKIYSVHYNNSTDAFYFTSKKKVMTFIAENADCLPIAAVESEYDPNWLYGEPLEKALQGIWDAKLITFFCKEGTPGYYFERYTVETIKVK